MTFPPDLPEPHAAFLDEALPTLWADERIVAVAAGGSFVTGGMDAYSDLDLVLAVEPAAVEAVMAERLVIAERLGPLLAGFTGEHVGEPRLIICLYGPPLLHVDLKFVSLPDAAERVEDPVILWERDGRLTAVMAEGEAVYPAPDLQWIEDRFWVWIHYGATKIGRGEVFEAHDFLAFLRMVVLGPLALADQGSRPTGVRKVEWHAQAHLKALRDTLSAYEPLACTRALRAAADLYRQLRDKHRPQDLIARHEAETATLAYLAALEARLAAEG